MVKTWQDMLLRLFKKEKTKNTEKQICIFSAEIYPGSGPESRQNEKEKWVINTVDIYPCRATLWQRLQYIQNGGSDIIALK